MVGFLLLNFHRPPSVPPSDLPSRRPIPSTCGQGRGKWPVAACRHDCSYLVEEQKTAFLEAGGPEEWLQGLQYAPKKLQDLHHTNLKLVKSGWSVSEIAHAICIMAQFHALSSYVHGCGIEAASGEIEVYSSPFVQACSSGSPSSRELSEGGVDILLERMKSLTLSHSDYSCISEELTRESFEKLKKQTANISTPEVECTNAAHSRYGHLSPDPEFMYDCSWEEHGFSLVSELYNEVGDLLDDKFKTAYNLTYYTCGHKLHVDTFLFRRGVWNYLHCLYGISQINQLLERNLKMFLKTVACYPEKLSCGDAASAIMKGFLQSEKAHVMILVLEARLQAELLHGLRALGHYLM
ncbi:Sestrin-3-like [Homarus americanus]|uniref:Sestrin-3-like n=1 Tax=Homarus americanus TaxID=6706 RepID=A0A8J5JJK5_HOMAM|nr:Sestrin-3-like [Homarus americanus]